MYQKMYIAPSSGRSSRFYQLSIAISVIRTLGCMVICIYLIPEVACQSQGSASHPLPQWNVHHQQPKLQQQQSTRRPSNQQNLIYINPNLSTSSAGFRTGSVATSQQQINAANNKRSLPNSTLSTSGSIGRGEQNQLAEWPFYKSLQSKAKNNNFNGNNQQQQTIIMRQQGPMGEPDRTMPRLKPNSELRSSGRASPASDHGSVRSVRSELASGLLVGPRLHGDERSGKMIETTTNTEPISTTLPPMEAPTTMIPSTTTTTTTTSTTTTTTTTPAPVAEPPTGPANNDPLFLPEFHKSLQKAVNRIVKMTEETMKNKQMMMSSINEDNDDEQGSPPGRVSGSVGAPQNSGGGVNHRSSLSLNVLLKNFGVHNLTYLDQILLKSTLNHDRVKPQTTTTTSTTNAKKQESATGNQSAASKEQKIEINGVLMNDKLQESGASSRDQSESGDSSEMAECKIEYTMKHVNITLLNGAKSDYSCDYIIDRKLHNTSSSNLVDYNDGQKICKLQITSSFFSNNDKEDCNNGTHLAIGERYFCYLAGGGENGDQQSTTTLNRVFDFPIERDDFDIKMVHKQQRSSQLGDSDDEHQNESEIHLEIKPLSDGECQAQSTNSMVTATGQLPPAAGVEYEIIPSTTQLPPSDLMISPASSTTWGASPIPNGGGAHTSSPKPPAPENPITDTANRDPRQLTRGAGSSTAGSNQGDSSLAGSSAAPQLAGTSPKRKFVLSLPRDTMKHPLHPLNGRFKASQSFDLASPPTIDNERQQLGATSRTTTGSQKGELCDGMVHDAAMGQLFTPEYPNYYRANMSCSFVIKRASTKYCYLSLHFRDFDLINNKRGVQANDCSEDYLKIGTTRYCNKYAMIGHKMKLEFSSSRDNSSLELEFRSDHMQSGRGFLIKYHQTLCDQQQHLAGHRNLDEVNKSTTMIGDPDGVASSQRTLAPPMQQPDFELALRTTPLAPTNRPIVSGNKKQAYEDVTDGQHKSQNLTALGSQYLNETDKKTTHPGGFSKQPEVAATQQASGGMSTATSVMVPMASSVSSDSLALAGKTVVGSQTADLQHSSEELEQQRQTQDCNQVHSGMGFSLQSPNFPNVYDNNLQCIYYVRRNNSRVCYLELTFVKFDLEADSDCRYDFLEINGVRLCGSIKDLAHKTTRIYMFNAPLKAIKFQSDNSGSKSGFLIRADQLECGLDGSIMRQGKSNWDLIQPYTPSAPPADQTNEAPRQAVSGDKRAKPESRSTVIHTNSTRTFEYDSSALSRWPSARHRPQVHTLFSSQRMSDIVASTAHVGPTAQQGQEAAGKSSSSSKTSCDELLFGKEVTIRSPLWPESYANDDSINSCRYTILRESSGTIKSNKICQLELRFVNLRLGMSDCIDVDGYEVLCGFNTRNMVKYYPFDRQSHLSINFFTGSSKLAARSLLQNSDLLPARGPLRFMIIAKQHECIDDFLAPQADLATTGYNQTNLLYSLGSLNAPNRATTGIESPQNGTTNTRGAPRLKTDSLLRYDFSSSLPSITRSAQATHHQQPVLMYSLINAANSSSAGSLQAAQKSNTDGLPTSGCLLDGAVSERDEQLYSANYPLGYRQSSHCLLTLTKQSEKTCAIELEFLDLDLDQPLAKFCDLNYLQVNGGERYCNMGQVERRLGPRRQLLVPFDRTANKVELLFHTEPRPRSSGRGFLIRHRAIEDCDTATDAAPTSLAAPHKQAPGNESPKPINRHILSIGGGSSSSPSSTSGSGEEGCLVQFNQYNGIFSSSAVLSKLRMTSGSHQSFSECQVKMKLLSGFCHLQLTFGEFELNPRIKNICIGEWLELNGVRYCGDELKNSSRLLPANLASPDQVASQRAVMIHFAGSISSIAQFRAIFKQIECQPEPLRPLANQPPADHTVGSQTVPASPSAGAPSASSSPTQAEVPMVQFKEIVSKNEFFELNSAKLSKSSDSYDANMFIVYRIKKTQAEVCKLRLMFYRFDLEPSLGCKRDFLDVNNVDRLCGQLSKPEDTRRDYDWPGERDFLVSFVSDSTIQREGYLLFGQQLHSNCSDSSPQPHMPTFDEDQPNRPQASPATTPTTPATTSTTTPAPAAKFHPGNNQPTPKEGAPQTLDNANCYKLFYEQNFEISSPGWPQKYKPKSTCHYLVHRSQADICSVTFNVVSMILGPSDEGLDSPGASSQSCKDASSKDHLELGDQVVLCGLLSRPQAITIHFDKSQFITAKFSSIQGSGFGFFIEGKQNKCEDNINNNRSHTTRVEEPPTRQAAAISSNDEEPPERVTSAKMDTAEEPQTDDEAAQTKKQGGSSCNRLLINEFDTIESERFPQNYPHNQDCLYALRRQNQSICAVDLILNHFELEPSINGSCESDYLEIDYSRFCGSYPARHRLRFNYFQDELDKFIRFRSDSALAKSGFSILVSQISDCNYSTSPASSTSNSDANDEIISYLPDVNSYSTANLNSSLVGQQPQAGGANQMSAPPNGPVANSTQVARLGKQLPEQQSSFDHSSSPSIVSGQTSQTLCQFVYHKERQYLLSPNYNQHRLNYDNNLDCLYKIVARSYDHCYLRLTFIDLDLEQSSECHNDYLLIDNQRYCGSSANGGNQKKEAGELQGLRTIEIQFSETLPREIDLLFHTSAHSNEGRGFKLLYEQLPCNTQIPGPEDSPGVPGPFRTPTGAAIATGSGERETRRQHFGQLSYPSHYVSSSSVSGPQRHSQSGENQRKQAANHRRALPLEAWSEPGLSTQTHRVAGHPQTQRGASTTTPTPTHYHPTGLMSDGPPKTESEEPHDDITLRKEIVVIKPAPIQAVH